MEIYIGIPQAIVLLFLIGLLICAGRETKGKDGNEWESLYGGVAIIVGLVMLLWWGGFFTVVCVLNPC